MNTIKIDKKKINRMEDLVDAINEGFKKTSFAIDSLEKRIDSQHRMIVDIHTNFVTKTEFKGLEKEVIGIRDDMSKLLNHFGIEEDEN